AREGSRERLDPGNLQHGCAGGNRFVALPLKNSSRRDARIQRTEATSQGDLRLRIPSVCQACRARQVAIALRTATAECREPAWPAVVIVLVLSVIAGAPTHAEP